MNSNVSDNSLVLHGKNNAEITSMLCKTMLSIRYCTSEVFIIHVSYSYLRKGSGVSILGAGNK